MFDKDSALVKVWLKLINDKTKTIDDVPSLGNLKEVIEEILNSQEGGYMDEPRIVRVEARIDNVEERLDKNEKAIDKHSQEIEELNQSVINIEKDLLLLQQTTNNTLDNTRDIKVEVKELRRLRDEDHLYKPKAELDKTKSQIVAIFIGAIVTFLLYEVLPVLKQMEVFMVEVEIVEVEYNPLEVSKEEFNEEYGKDD